LRSISCQIASALREVSAIAWIAAGFSDESGSPRGAYAIIRPTDWKGEERHARYRMTRIKLTDLAARITNRLPDYPESSADYANARINLCNIRRVLARRDISPG
jgi:hypothetical protein